MNTRDFSEFGHRERQEAATLLKLYGTNEDDSSLGEKISVEFNPSSGNVFLVDEDYSVAMELDGKLVDWVSCPNCGHEDYAPYFKDSALGDCCLEYHKEISE